jgi:hypothetical protein
MSQKESLIKILSEIKKLTRFGENAVLRRATTILEKEIRECDPEASQRLVDLGLTTRCGDDVIMSRQQAIVEFQQEDRRRSVFMDPKESYIQNLIDLHTGRLDVVEFRTNSEDTQFFSDYEADLKEEAAKQLPMVSVNLRFYSKTDIITMLRRMADELETREETPEGPVIPGVTHYCRLNSVEMTPAWFDNGRRLELKKVDLYECKEYDSCCRNQIVYIHKNPRIETWNDGDYRNPPPLLQPQFVEQPWTQPFPLVGPGGGGWKVTSDWGWRNLNGIRDFHGGIDVKSFSEGVIVVSPRSGNVVVARGTNYSDSIIVIATGRKLIKILHTIPTVGLGAINVGQEIGYSASTIDTGFRAHVHVEVFPAGTPLDRLTDENSLDPLVPGNMD